METKPAAKTQPKKPAASTKAKPAPKASSKAAAKPTANPATAAKAAAKAAAPTTAIKPLVKPEDVTARDGTWTRFMILAALKSGSKEAAQEKIDASKEFAGRRMDMAWLVKKGYIQ